MIFFSKIERHLKLTQRRIHLKVALEINSKATDLYIYAAEDRESGWRSIDEDLFTWNLASVDLAHSGLKGITRSRGKILGCPRIPLDYLVMTVSFAESELLNPRARMNDNGTRVVVVWPGRPTTLMYILLFDATCWSSERERERGNGRERPRRRVATRPSTRAIGASGMPSKNCGRSWVAGSPRNPFEMTAIKINN